MAKQNTAMGYIFNFLLYVVPFICLLGLLIVIGLGYSNLSLLASYMVIPIISAFVVFIKFKTREFHNDISNIKIFQPVLLLYTIIILINIYLLYVFEIRPLMYYILFSILFLLILIEIIFVPISSFKELIILIQIFILLIINTYSVTLNYYYFTGRTDIFGHAWVIEELVRIGHLTDVFGIYKPFPLWHILVASFIDVLGINLSSNRAMFLVCGFLYVFLMLSVFILSNKILINRKIALMSVLFASINIDVLFYSMYSIPRSIIPFFQLLLLILFLLPYNMASALCITILTIALIIYHTASMPFIILQLILIYLIKYLLFKDIKESLFNLRYLVTAIIATIVYWIYYAEDLFEVIVQNMYLPSASHAFAKGVTFSPIEELFNYLQFSPIIFFFFLGLWWTLSSTKNFKIKIFAILGVIFFPLTFPGPFLLIGKIANNLNLDRLGEYSFIYIAILCSMGFYYFYLKSSNYLKPFIIFLLVITSFLSVSNDFVASDNPLVKRPFYTFYLSESEITSINHLAEKSENGLVMSDYVVTRYLDKSKFEFQSHILEVNKYKNKFLKNKNDIILIRYQELITRPLKFLSLERQSFALKPSWNSLDYYYKDLDLWRDLINYNKIYMGKSVAGYK